MLVTATLLLSLAALAHHGHHTEDKPLPPKTAETKLQAINQKYVRSIKPIFDKKCADCHSSRVQFPNYYKFPIAKQIIDHDISEGRHHLDITNDFPFGGHGSMADNFKAIREEVTEGDMPPWRYTFIHNEATLTPQEKEIILKWVSESESFLAQP